MKVSRGHAFSWWLQTSETDCLCIISSQRVHQVVAQPRAVETTDGRGGAVGPCTFCFPPSFSGVQTGFRSSSDLIPCSGSPRTSPRPSTTCLACATTSTPARAGRARFTPPSRSAASRARARGRSRSSRRATGGRARAAVAGGVRVLRAGARTRAGGRQDWRPRERARPKLQLTRGRARTRM